MTKEFVPYELAFKLKQLGFDEECLGFYERNQELIIQECLITDFHSDSLQCVAPLFQQAFRWFREEHELSCSIKLTDDSRHYYYDFIIYDSEDRDYNDEDCFDSCGIILSHGKFGKYEEAELACLDKLIEIVELKQQEQ
jgi:hypothetical protein